MRLKFKSTTVRTRVKPAFFIAACLPGLWVATQWGQLLMGIPNDLTFNPIEYTIRFFGDWAFHMLLVTLAITPISNLLGTSWPVALRRMSGLFVFAYASAHLAVYLALDLEFSILALWDDVVKRIYITLGMAAFLLLIPLAVTSTHKMIKRLGAKRWRVLHRSIYAIGVLVSVHYILMVKGFQIEPLIYAAALGFLLFLRLKPLILQRQKRIIA